MVSLAPDGTAVDNPVVGTQGARIGGGISQRDPILLLLGLLSVPALVLLALRVLGTSHASVLSQGPDAVMAGTISLGLLATVVAVRERVSRAPEEAVVWRLMLLAAALISAGSLVHTGLHEVLHGLPGAVTEQAGQLPDLIFAIGCTAACVCLFKALTGWNRLRLGNHDPGGDLNGLAAVLIVVSIGNLVAPRLHDIGEGIAFWRFQLNLLSMATLTIVLGTALSVGLISLVSSDVRMRIFVPAVLLPLGFGGTEALTGRDTLAAEASWLLAAAAIVLCAALTPRVVLHSAPPPPTREATIITAQATSRGALGVLFAGIVILAVGDLVLDDSRISIAFAVLGVAGAATRVLSLVNELAELGETRRDALTDDLTGIPNRRALLARIDEALVSATTVSLLIVDLDRFKVINDRFGHMAGDELLQNMAATFGDQVPEGAVLARLGSDEFAVLLTDVPPAVSGEVAAALVAAAAPPSDVNGRLVQVGASVGIATVDAPSIDDQGIDSGELLRRADTAMYRAKTAGTGVESYDSAVDARAQEQLDLLEDLHRALGAGGNREQREQIVVWFQPQLCTRTGRVLGAEALVRWAHPRRGMIPPDSFLDLAEQNGLMWALTERVVRESVGHAMQWRAEGHLLRVSVNLSAGCLSNPALLPLVDEVMATASGLPAGDLVLEVTETGLMTDPERALAAMNRLAARGLGISIDDYGTGYSSLSYLNDLPASELKIDRSFTARVTGDPRTRAIVAGTVELAHRLGMRLIVEGVEDEPTLEVMARLGCDETQGYLHSRPLPPEAFLDWLRTHESRSARATTVAGAQAEGSGTVAR